MNFQQNGREGYHEQDQHILETPGAEMGVLHVGAGGLQSAKNCVNVSQGNDG